MNNDINVFLNFIKERTGICISLYNGKGERVVGDIEFTDKTVFPVTEILQTGNVTLFPIKYKNKSYVGCIDGATDSQKKYALLICELAENVFYKETDFSRADFFKSLLHGELNYAQIRKYLTKFSVPERTSCCTLLVTVEKNRIEEVINVLKTYGEETDVIVKNDEYQCVFIRFLSQVEDEYHSSQEYSEFLIQSIYEETGVPVRISIGGTVKSIYDLNVSYVQALTALRMSKELSSKGEVHTFKEYVLIKMLEDMPKYKLNEYLEILTDSNAKEIFSDTEMINTAEEFLENSLNVSETSRNLYLHRNTLTYRLDKIEKMTGLNLRKFSDAITFRLITLLAKLLNE